jgi:hypothetical protein
MKTDSLRTDSERDEPTGVPVVRGDPAIAGDRAETAIEFDPNDPDSLIDAEQEVQRFANELEESSAFEILCGAAACATLVRGEQSYQKAADRVGNEVSVNFLRKWARVHDLPVESRRYIALREIVPSAAQHVARVQGDARFMLAWAISDQDLSVRDVRSIASTVNDGEPVQKVLERFDALPGQKELAISTETYHELRLAATKEAGDLDTIIEEAIELWLDSRNHA